MDDVAARLRWRHDTWEAPDADAELDALVSRHREPHRRYHAERHVRAVVRDVTSLLRTVRVADPPTVRLAAWFHDAVYDPRSSSNESDSAGLARHVLTGLAASGPATDDVDRRAARIEEVERLVLLTATHAGAGVHDDPGGSVLLDADLAVLGGGPAAYEDYVRGVRAEYAHVTDEAWRTGRAIVLERFLGRPAIYATPEMRRRLEERARANLTSELATIRRS